MPDDPEEDDTPAGLARPAYQGNIGQQADDWAHRGRGCRAMVRQCRGGGTRWPTYVLPVRPVGAVSVSGEGVAEDHKQTEADAGDGGEEEEDLPEKQLRPEFNLLFMYLDEKSHESEGATYRDGDGVVAETGEAAQRHPGRSPGRCTLDVRLSLQSAALARLCCDARPAGRPARPARYLPNRPQLLNQQ